jgi:hypothetical protein
LKEISQLTEFLGSGLKYDAVIDNNSKDVEQASAIASAVKVRQLNVSYSLIQFHFKGLIVTFYNEYLHSIDAILLRGSVLYMGSILLSLTLFLISSTYCYSSVEAVHHTYSAL